MKPGRSVRLGIDRTFNAAMQSGRRDRVSGYSTLPPRCRSASIFAAETLDGSRLKMRYISIMSVGLKELLEKTASWPKEDQDELAEVAAEIEARRTGQYTLNNAERTAVTNGLEQVRRGEYASDLEMQSFWKRFGLE